MSSSEGHKPLYICLIVLMLLGFAAMAFFNGMASRPDIIPGLYRNETGDISDKYYLEITPAGWTFSIWGFIYAYQVIFLGYILSTLCRRYQQGGYLYYAPGFLPPAIYVIYFINNILNLAWLIVFDRQYLVIGLVIIALTPATLYLCIGLSMHRLHKYGDDLVMNGHHREPALVIGIIHNGLGMYAAWVTIATLLNLAMVLTYVVGMPQSLASTVSLCFLAFDAVVYAIVDHIIFEKFFRHLYTPYMVLHVALIGSLYKNFNLQSHNTIFTIGLVAIGAFVFIFKIGYSIYRSRTKPLFTKMGNSKVEL